MFKFRNGEIDMKNVIKFPKQQELYQTLNDLPQQTRVELVEMLNHSLADAVDLSTQMKQAHWNVKGPSFIGLHKLFDEVHEGVESYVDSIAERLVQLGGIAEGTARMASSRTKLEEYPLDQKDGMAHATSVSKALSAFGKEARLSIEKASELKDADTADLFTEISRGIDKWLWFVESHTQTVK